jgi:hypothetical protein
MSKFVALTISVALEGAMSGSEKVTVTFPNWLMLDILIVGGAKFDRYASCPVIASFVYYCSNNAA